jgi:hypothetical protein
MVTARSVPPTAISPDGELQTEYSMPPTGPETRCTHPPLLCIRKSQMLSCNQQPWEKILGRCKFNRFIAWILTWEPSVIANIELLSLPWGKHWKKVTEDGHHNLQVQFYKIKFSSHMLKDIRNNHNLDTKKGLYVSWQGLLQMLKVLHVKVVWEVENNGWVEERITRTDVDV